jgi:hypothetical protein
MRPGAAVSASTVRNQRNLRSAMALIAAASAVNPNVVLVGIGCTGRVGPDGPV